MFFFFFVFGDGGCKIGVFSNLITAQAIAEETFPGQRRHGMLPPRPWWQRQVPEAVAYIDLSWTI